MAKVKSADLFDKDLLKGTIDEFKALLAIVGNLKGEIVELAKIQKKLGQQATGTKGKTKQIKELTKAEEEAIRLAKEKQKVEKEEKKLTEQLIKAQDEEVKGKIRLQKANKAQKDELKDLLILENKQSGTLEKLAAVNRKLRREREKLNLSTEQGRARLKKINFELDKNNAKIRKNSDALKKQKLNVGNYTSSIKEAAQSSGLFGGVLSKLSAIQGTLQALNKKAIVTQEITTANTYKQIAASKALTRSKKSQLIAQKALNTAVKASLVGIALIAAGGLVATFTRTQKRVDQLSDAMASMGAIVDIVIDRFSGIGEGIIDIFNKGLLAFDKFKLLMVIGAKELKLELQEALSFEVAGKSFGVAKEAIVKTQEELKELNGKLDDTNKGIKDIGKTKGFIDLITGAFDGLGTEIEREIALASKFNKLRRELNREQRIFSIHLNDEIEANKKLQIFTKNKLNDDAKRIEALEKIRESEKLLAAEKIRFAEEELRLSLDSEKSFKNLSADRKKFIQDLKDGAITSEEAIKRAEDFTLSSSAGEEALFNIIDKINKLKQEEINLDDKLLKITKQISGVEKERGAKISKGLLVVAQEELALAKNLERSQEDRFKNLLGFQEASVKAYQVQLDANIITQEEFNARVEEAERKHQAELKNIRLSNESAAFALEEFRRERAIKEEKDIEERLEKELDLVDFRTIKLLDNEELLQDERTLIIEKANADRKALQDKADADKLAQQKAADEKTKEQTAETAQQVNQLLEDLQSKQEARFAQRLSDIDEEVNASKEREQKLREITKDGIVDADENLAFEQRKQAELQREKEKEQKRQAIKEIGFSALKTYTAKIESGEKGGEAVLSTVRDLSLLLSAVEAVGSAAFIEGSDHVAKDLNPSLNTGQDDYIIRVDGSEKVFKPEHSKRIGYDMTNEDVVGIVERFKRGEMVGDSIDNYIVGGGYQSNEAIISKLDDVKSAIENQKTQDFKYNDVEKAITTITTERNRVVRNHVKQKGIW